MAAKTQNKSLCFDLSTKSLELKAAPLPKVATGEVLVRVAFSGICGTDLHVIHVSLSQGVAKIDTRFAYPKWL